MPKATPINKTSVGLGRGGPWKGPDFPAMPVTEWPDRRSPDDQRDYGDDLVAGLDPAGGGGVLKSWNPDNQPAKKKSWNPGK